MLKNKKGFTLVEILATVTILGILMGAAIFAVSGIIENGKEEHYNTAEDNLAMAGQSYAQQNRAALPKAIGQKTKIPLSMLKDKNYIGEIKDYSDNNCDPEKSYVQIYKYSQTEYSYSAYLECPGYNSEEKVDARTPEITATVTSPNDNPKLNINIKGNDKLMSYSYIIYRGSNEVKNTGNVTVASKAEVTKTESLAAYTPAKVKIVIVATNIYGNTATKTLTSDLKDTKAPVCIIDVADGETTATKSWINNGTRKITVGCDDGDGSGCKRETYTKTFKTSTDVGTITISDESGNTTDCRVAVRIDKETPKITVKAYKRTSAGGKTGDAVKSTTLAAATSLSESKTLDLSTLHSSGWINKANYEHGVYLDIEVEDGYTLQNYKERINPGNLKTSTTNDSDMTTILVNETPTTKKVNKYQAITIDGYRTMAVIATDKAGNTARVNIKIPLDRILPVCSSNNAPAANDWTINNRTITQYCSDTLSECVRASYAIAYSTTTTTSSVTIADKAGNTNTCNYNVYVDKTKPTTPTAGAIGAVSGSSSSASIKTAASGSTDSHSGLSGYRYLVKNDSATPAKTAVTATSLAFTRACGKSYYAWAVAVDNVGNISDVKYLGTTSDGANSYSGWTTCSASCGGGTQTRTNTCALVTTGLSQSCNTQGCCDSTTTTWDSYGGCSASCGGGTKYRTGYLYSTYNGQYCGTTTGSASCNTHGCCDSTYAGGWSGYGGCSASCGGGTKSQYRYHYSSYNSGWCWTEYDYASCNTQGCCDSTWGGGWGGWGGCSASCGGGTQYRYQERYSSYNNGWCWTESASQSCNTHSCCTITAHNGTLCWTFASNNMGGGANYNNGKLSICKDAAGTNCAPGDGKTVDYACGRLSVYGYNYFKYCP